MLRIIHFFKLFLLSLLILQSSFAHSNEAVGLTAGLEEDMFHLEGDLSSRMQFISLMLKTGEEIDREGEIDQALLNRPEKLTALLQNKIKIYYQFYEKALNIPIDQRALFKKMFLSMDWKKLVPLIKKSHMGIELFFKKKGFGLGIAVMAGIICEYAVPAILIHMGLPHLIPLSMMTPWSTIYSFIPGYLHKLKIKKMLNESLGGKIEVEAFLKQQENVLKNLHMKSPDDFIFPVDIDENVTKSLVIEKSSLHNTIKDLLGFNQNRLNYDSLRRFIDSNSLNDSYINWIIHNDRVSKEVKAGFMASHILNLENPAIKIKFMEEYSEFVIHLQGKTNWEETWSWTQEMKKIRNFDELYKKIDEAPVGIGPKEFAAIWENMLLPEYAMKFDQSYSESRRMFEQFDELKVKLLNSKGSEIDYQAKDLIFKYLKKIVVGKSFKGCRNTPAQINQFLLRKI